MKSIKATIAVDCPLGQKFSIAVYGGSIYGLVLADWPPLSIRLPEIISWFVGPAVSFTPPHAIGNSQRLSAAPGQSSSWWSDHNAIKPPLIFRNGELILHPRMYAK